MSLTRADDAEANFKSGFSCSQAVCLAFANDFGIDREHVSNCPVRSVAGWHIRPIPAER